MSELFLDTAVALLRLERQGRLSELREIDFVVFLRD